MFGDINPDQVSNCFQHFRCVITHKGIVVDGILLRYCLSAPGHGVTNGGRGSCPRAQQTGGQNSLAKNIL